ncbi:MAG: HD family hydrolase [Hyphomicrobium sp.]|nr:HD family hydrolase [Hyphomicrobium sp.]
MNEPLHSKPVRAWQRMLSGRRLDLLQPSPDDIEIEDIAHGLARVARWNGQTTGAHAFSVAQHSLIVTDIFENLNPTTSNAERRAALLHDAPEYVIGDLISPFKAAIGLDYKAFERRLLAAIHRRFDIPETLSPVITNAIKDADRIAAFFEATCLAGFSIEEGRAFFGRADVNGSLRDTLQTIEPLPAKDAHRHFIARFDALARI